MFLIKHITNFLQLTSKRTRLIYMFYKNLRKQVAMYISESELH